VRRLLHRLANDAPGGLGTPLYGHNDPCARSSLNGLRTLAQARKRGPGIVRSGLCRALKTPQATRREAGHAVPACLRRLRERVCGGVAHSD
jgi:hypothetical protein